MTRINTVKPSELLDKHLQAELKELTRIPNGVVNGKLKLTGSYPDSYRLGAGHVKFYIPRLGYLYKRYQELRAEWVNRGFEAWTDYWPDHVPTRLMNDWTPTVDDVILNVHRLIQQTPKNPRYYRGHVESDYYNKLLQQYQGLNHEI